MANIKYTMKNANLNKVIENVYSLKKQRTLSHILDLEVEKKAKESPQKNFIIRKNHCRTKTFIDKLEPIESLKAISQRKQSLADLYSSKILPSQFLVTPVDVLEKLKEKVYCDRKGKKVEEKSVFHECPSMVVDRSCKGIKYLNKNSDGFDTVLKNSCEMILEDNRKSRKTLEIATQFLSKRKVLNEILVDKSNFSEAKEFKRRLRDAHNHLVNIDKIQGVNSYSRLVSV